MRVCTRNEKQWLVQNPFATSATGKYWPWWFSYKNNMHVLFYTESICLIKRGFNYLSTDW